MKRWMYGLLLGIMMSLLIGCNNTSDRYALQKEETSEIQENSETAEKTGGPYYKIEQKLMPDMNYELENLLYPGAWISNGYLGDSSMHSVDGTYYRQACIWDMQDDDWDTTTLRHRYVQYLEAPYTTWKVVEVPDTVEGDGWSEDGSWWSTTFRVTQEGQMQYLLATYDENYEVVGQAIGVLYKDGTHEMYENPSAEDIESFSKAAVTDSEKKQMEKTTSFYPFQTARDAEGTLYFGNVDGIWKCTDTKPEILIGFKKENLIFKEVLGFVAAEQGFQVLGTFGGRTYLAELIKSDTPVIDEKIEIVLAEASTGDNMRAVISDFNRQSEKYKVVCENVEGSGDYQEFWNKQRLEISVGKGPDIFASFTVEGYEEEYIRNGYLMEFEDFLGKDKASYVSGVLQAGMHQGKRYGVPYGFNVNLFATSTDVTGGRASWTVKEYMEAVKNSGASCAFGTTYTEDNSYVLMYDGLVFDDGTFIDWEKRESHLDQKEFVEFLEFCKKYSQKGLGLTDNNHGKKLQSGEILLADTQLLSLNDYLVYEKLYGDKLTFMGYPSDKGSGMQLLTRMYYASGSSEKREGIEEFFRFLVSKEGQMDYCIQEGYSGFSVRKDVLETALERAQKGIGNKGMVSGMRYGIEYKFHTMSENVANLYRDVFERAQAETTQMRQIFDIFNEEAAPFFAGDITAERAAQLLHNRVQLFLNE